MIAVESGVHTPFLQPDLDIAAIVNPCLESQGLQDFLDDPGSAETDFDPALALEELFRYLGDGPPQHGEPRPRCESPALPGVSTGLTNLRPSLQDLHNTTNTGDDFAEFSTIFGIPQSLPVPQNASDITSSDVDMPLSAPVPARVSTPLQTPFSTPPSPMSTSEEDEKSTIPRHKRPAHKRAEVKRRGKIKTKIDDLKEMLPPMQNQRKSETVILNKAAEYCRQLKMDMGRHGKEKESLKAEIAALSAEIDNFQKELPAMGLKAEPRNKMTMEDQYNEYVRREIRKDWKFWIFSFISRPLFDAYNEGVSTSSLKDFLATIGQWTRNTLGLQNLRSVVMKGVLRISKETEVMTKPENLPKEALQSVAS